MSKKFCSEYLSRIEWEGLQDKIGISQINESNILNDTAQKIELYRDEHYKIKSKVFGVFKSKSKELVQDGIAGDVIKSTEIKGTNYHGLEKFTLSHCYLGNISYKFKNESILSKSYEAELLVHRIKREYSNSSISIWLTEWYICYNKCD